MSSVNHLLGEHRDVVEVSVTSLLHRQREEKPAPVLGEQRILSLQRETPDFKGHILHAWTHRAAC